MKHSAKIKTLYSFCTTMYTNIFVSFLNSRVQDVNKLDIYHSVVNYVQEFFKCSSGPV